MFGLFNAPDPISDPLNPSDAGSYTYLNSRLGVATDPSGLVREKQAVEAAQTGGTVDCESRCEQGSGDTGEKNPLHQAVQDGYNIFAAFWDGGYSATIGSVGHMVGAGDTVDAWQGWLREHGGADTETESYATVRTVGEYTTTAATFFIPVGGVVKVGQALDRALALSTAVGKGVKFGAPAASEVRSGIYIVNTRNGVYVGQSSNITRRLAQHVKSGKFTADEVANAARQSVRGGKGSREIAEQMMIDRLGGIDNLLNHVNPIGPRRFGQMPNQPYFRG